MKPKLNQITSIILAGGESTRMGQDKGFLGLEGKPMIQYGIDTAKCLSNHIIVIANNKSYHCLGVPVFPDVYIEKGPLGGIHSGLTHSNTDWNWVIGCDMPQINTGLAKYLFNHLDKHQIIVPLWEGKPQPLCALYNKNCVNDLESCIKKGELKMSDVLSTLKVNFINITKDLEFYSPLLFTNLNDQQDVDLFNTNKHES